MKLNSNSDLLFLLESCIGSCRDWIQEYLLGKETFSAGEGAFTSSLLGVPLEKWEVIS